MASTAEARHFGAGNKGGKKRAVSSKYDVHKVCRTFCRVAGLRPVVLTALPWGPWVTRQGQSVAWRQQRPLLHPVAVPHQPEPDHYQNTQHEGQGRPGSGSVGDDGLMRAQGLARRAFCAPKALKGLANNRTAPYMPWANRGAARACT